MSFALFILNIGFLHDFANISNDISVVSCHSNQLLVPLIKRVQGPICAALVTSVYLSRARYWMKL